MKFFLPILFALLTALARGEAPNTAPKPDRRLESLARATRIKGEIVGRTAAGVYVKVDLAPSSAEIALSSQRKLLEAIRPTQAGLGQRGAAASGISARVETVFIANFRDAFARDVDVSVKPLGRRDNGGVALLTFSYEPPVRKLGEGSALNRPASKTNGSR